MHFKTLPYKLLYYFAKRALIWKHTHTQHYNLDSSHFQKLAGVGLTHYLITTPKHCSKKVTDSVHDINYHIYMCIYIYTSLQGHAQLTDVEKEISATPPVPDFRDFFHALPKLSRKVVVASPCSSASVQDSYISPQKVPPPLPPFPGPWNPEGPSVPNNAPHNFCQGWGPAGPLSLSLSLDLSLYSF